MNYMRSLITTILLACTFNASGNTDAYNAIDLFTEMYDGVENVGLVITEKDNKLEMVFINSNQPLKETCDTFKAVAPSLDHIVISFYNQLTGVTHEKFMKCDEK